ncbi:MAG TPA: terminase family protein [Candidatus Acidoferrales bacterium]|nr:terminase family protein [Candidatus Acidoferrales bacterium]
MDRIEQACNRGEDPEEVENGGAAEWARKELGFEADATQRRVLNSRSRRVLLNCTRQWGKSTVTAAKAVHEAWTIPGSLTLVVSPSARQSGEFLRKAEEFARRLGVKPKGDGDNDISMLLPNRARIVGLPGREATVRGFSAVTLLLVDEASRVCDELYLSLRPMLAVSNGTLWLMSTPHGKSGFFWETWQNAGRGDGGGWERVRVPAAECPRIPKEFLEEERKTMGDLWFRQEYGCEFVDAVSGVFDRDTVERAVRRDVEPLEL